MLPERMSFNDRKLMYIQSMKGLMNTSVIFSDCTENFLSPCEPEPFDTIRVKLRTSRANVDNVYLCSEGKEHLMKVVESDLAYDYYGIDIKLSDKKFEYYFKIVNGYEECFYDSFGCYNTVRPEYSFAITPGFKTPDWAKGAVMYQIYVDRFYNGDKTNDVLDREYSYIDDYAVQCKDWNKYPAAMGVREFYGGDLQGVLDKMDYLEKLGVEVIYFNPLFVSPSNHKYDIQDYDYIDPHFGKIVVDEGEVLPEGEYDNVKATKFISRVTRMENLEASNELFAYVVEEAHKRGIKVIIDGVFNHSGSFNKWMDRERIYENQEGYEKGAFVAKDSPYNTFYKFTSEEDKDWPYNKNYDGWWAHDTLPKLNYEASDKLEEYILNIGKKWVSAPYNVDGWRLDVAADLGHSEEYNHQFWKKFRRVVKEANPNAIVLAEHYGNPESWLQGDEWDTIMNYDAFMEPITWFLTGMEKHSDRKEDSLLGNSENFFNTMKHYMSKFQMPSLLVAMNELSNHDHSRFLTRTNRTVGRTASLGPGKANEGIDKAVFREAIVMQMTWPGAPTLYYGDEAGVCGWTDPDNRRTYPWGNEDLDLIEFYREMIGIHKRHNALKKGSFVELHREYNVVSYGRFHGRDKVITIVNNNDTQKTMNINLLPIGIFYENNVERRILTTEFGYNAGKVKVHISNSELSVTMPPKSAAVYVSID